MNFLMQLLWILQYEGKLEAQQQPADHLFMLLFCCGCLLTVTVLLPSLGLVFLSSCLVFTLIYVWSRQFPNDNVSIWGIVNIQSFYLPFAFVGLNVLLGGSPVPDVIGICTGHLYWFLVDIYPRQYGRQLLQTPHFLKVIAAKMELEGSQVEQSPTNTVTNMFSAFRGTGRRLGSR